MKKFNKKTLVLLVCVALLLTCSVGSTVAYLADKADEVINTFTPVKVDTYIDETVGVGEKTGIEIVNKQSDENNTYIPVYVRVALAGNWVKMVDNKEVIVGPATKEEMTFNLGDKWILHTDGFYYYTEVLNPGKRTSNLLGSSIGATKDDGSYLVVMVVHQAIQADGMKATGVVDAFTKAAE